MRNLHRMLLIGMFSALVAAAPLQESARRQAVASTGRTTSAQARGPAAPGKGTLADYRRAALYQNFDLLAQRTTLKPNWIGTGHSFWYIDKYKDVKTFVRVDPDTNSQAPAFDHARLAKELSRVLAKPVTADALPVSEIAFRANGASVALAIEDKGWRCSLADYRCVSGPIPRAKGEELSPDGRWAVSVKDHNLWLRDTSTDQAGPLSTDGIADFGYDSIDIGDDISATLTDTRPTPPLAFSPDSSRLIALKQDQRLVRQLSLLQTAPSGPGILRQYRFPLVGDAHVPVSTPVLFDLAARRRIAVDFPPYERMAYEGTLGWDDTPRAAYFTSNTRGQRQVSVHLVDAGGAVRTPVVETATTDIDREVMVASIDGGRQMLWASERDGWKHLYRFDGRTGRLINQVTRGPWVVRDLLKVDGKAGYIYFVGAGREPGDPYYRQLYRVRLDGSGLRRLTPEDGDHDISLAPDGRYFVDVFSRLDTPPRAVLRRADGGLVRELQRADIATLAAVGWLPPEPFQAVAADGKTPIYGAIYRPYGFDPSRKYPVIDSIYPGPQSIRTRKDFSVGTTQNDQALAQLGFIVVTVDGRGTPYRSRAFHDFSYGNMGSAGGLDDHIAALRQLAKRYPGFDLDRVGIYGHSGGGFASTRAMLLYPDFYKVAVSSAGNHDQRTYFAAWGERYQGYPVDDADYAAQANAPLAGSLKGHLLLAYGTLDDNVLPDNTLQLVDALIAHNKTFDLLAMPNRNHSMADLTKGKEALSQPDTYLPRRRWDYFVEHLMGVKPPRDFALTVMKMLPTDPEPNRRCANSKERNDDGRIEVHGPVGRRGRPSRRRAATRRRT